MKLKEVINKYALRFFGDYAEDVGETELDGNTVDMWAVADACDIPVIYMEGEDYSLKTLLSGNNTRCLDYTYGIIKINRFDSEDEWRQIIALSLSRLTAMPFASDVARLNKSYNTLVLNELLIPEKIFKAYFELAISVTNNGAYGIFGTEEVWNIAEYMAEKLHVEPVLLFERIAMDGFGFMREDFNY